MIGKVVYVGRGQVADARNGNLVSLRQLTAEWNAMVDAWDDIRVITAKMARFARLNNSWPCGDDIAAWARAINTALDRRKTTSEQQQDARPGNAAAHAMTMTLDEAIAHAEDVANRCDTSCGREHRQLADWLKELRDVKSRHVGNAAAMREALVIAKKAICHHAKHVCQSLSWENSNIQSNCADVLCANRDLCEAKTAINAALSAPARNCDVGTPEEQSQRFMDFCRPGNRPPNCEKCKVYPKRMNKFWCQLEWAQTPYAAEKGTEK